MSEFWQELIINWGGNAVLAGLVIYLGKIYLERTNRNEQATIDTVARDQQAELDKRLKSLEQDHEKILTYSEHFHQVSQKTYQKLFDEKIVLYQTLIGLKNSYLEKIINDPVDIHNLGIDDRESRYLKKFQEIIKTINNQPLYVSSDLFKKTNRFIEATAEEFNAIEGAIHFHNEYGDGYTQELYEVNTHDYTKIYKSTAKIRKEIIDQIDNDIISISRFINHNS